MRKKINFIVDTDSYAGSFEREMAAYMTGQVGDCGVGEEWADQYEEDGLPDLEDIILQVADDHGCFRPVEICYKGNNNGQYNSLQIFFSKKLTAKLIKQLKERAHAYAEENEIKVKGFRLIEETTKISKSKNI